MITNKEELDVILEEIIDETTYINQELRFLPMEVKERNIYIYIILEKIMEGCKK